MSLSVTQLIWSLYAAVSLGAATTIYMAILDGSDEPGDDRPIHVRRRVRRYGWIFALVLGALWPVLMSAAVLGDAYNNWQVWRYLRNRDR